jgi:KDO2-lipid IV(A) lauroyltransferase
MAGIGYRVERLTTLSLLALWRILALLPLQAQRLLGIALGDIAWVMGGSAARITRVNLELCFPDRPAMELDRLARASLRETGQLLTETGMLLHWPEARWRALCVAVEGDDLLRDALSAGRGVLLLVPHLGNWEYLSLYLGQFGVTALYDPPRIVGLDGPIRSARSRSGARLVAIGRKGIRGVIQALDSGRLVAILPDQVPERQSGVYADFFGRPALTMTLAGELARRLQPRVLVGAAVRTRGGFALRFAEAEPGVDAPDAASAAEAVNRCMERLVRAAPAQYQWEYKRFKRPPRGCQDPYRSP